MDDIERRRIAEDHPNREHFLASGLPACQCESTGYCSVYRKRMSPSLHRLCQNSQSHRDLSIDLAKRAIEIEKELPEERRKAREEQRKLQENATKFDKAIRELKQDGIELNKDSSAGLGDTVEKVLSKFGITQSLMEKVAGIKGCKCEERKAWLNKIFPYGKKKKDR